MASPCIIGDQGPCIVAAFPLSFPIPLSNYSFSINFYLSWASSSRFYFLLCRPTYPLVSLQFWYIYTVTVNNIVLLLVILYKKKHKVTETVRFHQHTAWAFYRVIQGNTLLLNCCWGRVSCMVSLKAPEWVLTGASSHKSFLEAVVCFKTITLSFNTYLPFNTLLSKWNALINLNVSHLNFWADPFLQCDWVKA